MITWPLILTCLVLAVVIGGGGFTLGCVIATDHADAKRAAQLAAELEAEQARRAPLAEQVYRPPLVALEAEPDMTMPLRAIPAAVGRLSAAAARILGRPPGPGSLEAHLAIEAHRAELEIADMIRAAEATVSGLGGHDV